MAAAYQEPMYQYKVGDLISRHDPFVKCLSMVFVESHCYRCFEPNCTIRCPHCNAVNYCEKKCMDADYEESHSVECDVWRMAPDYRRLCFNGSHDVADRKLFLLRLYALLHLHPHLGEKEYHSQSRFRTFNDLLSSTGTRFMIPGLQADCHIMAASISVALVKIEISLEALLPLAGVIQSMKVGIMNASQSRRIGWGVYFTPFFPHSCKPTVNFLTQGTELLVRAIANIPQGQVRISYLKDHMNLEERKVSLMNFYNEQCFCQRCQVGFEDEVHFERLKLLLQQRDIIWQTPYTDSCSWYEIYAKHLEILAMFRILYEEYDVNITDLFCKTLSIGVKLGVEKSHMMALAADTTLRVVKTYGIEHVKYKFLIAAIGEYFN